MTPPTVISDHKWNMTSSSSTFLNHTELSNFLINRSSTNVKLLPIIFISWAQTEEKIADSLTVHSFSVARPLWGREFFFPSFPATITRSNVEGNHNNHVAAAITTSGTDSFNLTDNYTNKHISTISNGRGTNDIETARPAYLQRTIRAMGRGCRR